VTNLTLLDENDADRVRSLIGFFKDDEAKAMRELMTNAWDSESTYDAAVTAYTDACYARDAAEVAAEVAYDKARAEAIWRTAKSSSAVEDITKPFDKAHHDAFITTYLRDKALERKE